MQIYEKKCYIYARAERLNFFLKNNLRIKTHGIGMKAKQVLTSL
jgi:hypothetical protein